MLKKVWLFLGMVAPNSVFAMDANFSKSATEEGAAAAEKPKKETVISIASHKAEMFQKRRFLDRRVPIPDLWSYGLREILPPRADPFYMTTEALKHAPSVATKIEKKGPGVTSTPTDLLYAVDVGPSVAFLGLDWGQKKYWFQHVALSALTSGAFAAQDVPKIQQHFGILPISIVLVAGCYTPELITFIRDVDQHQMRVWGLSVCDVFREVTRRVDPETGITHEAIDFLVTGRDRALKSLVETTGRAPTRSVVFKPSTFSLRLENNVPSSS